MIKIKNKIAICSLFRDSQNWFGKPLNQVEKFFLNMREQEKLNNVEFTYFLLEGDSTDNTLYAIEQHKKYFNINLIKYDVKGSRPSSDGSEERRKLLSDVGNKCLNSAIDAGFDYILWSESDLIPHKNMLGSLLEKSKIVDWDKTVAIAPTAIIVLQDKECFYDGWAYEGIDGEKWSVPDLERFLKGPNPKPMKAIGCAALLNGKLLRENKIDFGDGNFPKLCKTSIDKGFQIWCDTSSIIVHPSQHCYRGRWC